MKDGSPKKAKRSMREHYAAIDEQRQDTLQFIAETVTATNEKVEQIQHGVERLDNRMERLEQESFYIRHAMTTREELQLLESRVSILEKKNIYK